MMPSYQSNYQTRTYQDSIRISIVRILNESSLDQWQLRSHQRAGLATLMTLTVLCLTPDLEMSFCSNLIHFEWARHVHTTTPRDHCVTEPRLHDRIFWFINKQIYQGAMKSTSPQVIYLSRIRHKPWRKFLYSLPDLYMQCLANYSPQQ